MPVGSENLPFLTCIGRVTEQVVQRLRVYVERRVIDDMPLDDLQDIRCHLFGIVPVVLVPLLQYGHGCAGNLNIELDVLGQARYGEVGGPHQGKRADDVEPGVRDIGLGVKLVLGVGTALNLAGP